MGKKIRWGIVGTGYIANNFANGSKVVEDMEIVACSATSLDKANVFADTYGIDLRFDDFDAMLEKAKPDVVYIGIPNMLHFKFVMKALEKGINVLCEKPMADNTGQLLRMIEKAKEKKVFLMEAMWTRCFPVLRKVKEWLDSGKIGAVKSVRADFGLKATEGWQGWKASTKYSGGALRDVGIYSVAYAFLGFPNEVPQKIDSVCRLKDGADFHSELLFHYTGNRSAFLSGSFEMVTDHHAVFYGDAGVIVVGPNFWCPRRAELLKYNSEDEFSRERTELFEDDYPSSGMQYEIAHVAECIQNNKKESNLFPLSETIVIAELIDSLRKEWGVHYASDD